MGIEEFVIDVLDNLGLYLGILFIVLLLFVPIIKKYCSSIIDPMFYGIILVIFAYTVPPFLYLLDLCSNRNFFYFLSTELIFWLVILVMANPKSRLRGYQLKNEGRVVKALFYAALFLYVSNIFLMYALVGIPLFAESRQDLYSNAFPGAALLAKISSFGMSFVLFYAYHRIVTFKEKKYFILFFFIIITSLLSGSKSSILTLVFTYFYYKKFYLNENPQVKKKYLLLLLAFPICILIFGKEADAGGVGTAFILLITRFVANGDAYFMAYARDTIDNLHYYHPLINLFSGILGPMRLISYESLEPIIGCNLYWTVNPSQTGVIAGPNARLAVLSWLYFGYWGYLYVIIAAFIAYFFSFRIRKYLPHSLLGVFIYSKFYMCALSILCDSQLFLSNLFDVFLNMLIYTSLIFILMKYKLVFCRPK